MQENKFRMSVEIPEFLDNGKTSCTARVNFNINTMAKMGISVAMLIAIIEEDLVDYAIETDFSLNELLTQYKDKDFLTFSLEEFPFTKNKTDYDLYDIEIIDVEFDVFEK